MRCLKSLFQAAQNFLAAGAQHSCSVFLMVPETDSPDFLSPLSTEHTGVSTSLLFTPGNEALLSSYRAAQESKADFLYFVGSDILHTPEALLALVTAHTAFARNLGQDPVVVPTDLGIYYEPQNLAPAHVVAGPERHWRTVPFTGSAFLLSRAQFQKHKAELLELTPYIVHPNSVEESLTYKAHPSAPVFGPLPALAANLSSHDKITPFHKYESAPKEHEASAENSSRKNVPRKEIELVTIANKDSREMHLLLQSCRRFNVSLKVLGWSQPFPGLFWKPKVMRRYLASGDYAKHILFLDAYDTLLLDSLETIFQRFQAIGARLLLSAETNCHPEPSRARHYPPCSTPFRFVNSGAYIGEAEFLKTLLEKYPVEQTIDIDDDQNLFTSMYLDHAPEVAIDHHCQIFQSVGHAEYHLCPHQGRITNTTTQTLPSVLHFNGKAETKRVLGWLQPHPRPHL